MATVVFIAGGLPAALLMTTPAHAAPGGDAIIEETTFTLGPFSENTSVVVCPTGRRAVGGGVGTTAADVDSQMRESGPAHTSGAPLNDGAVAPAWEGGVFNNGETSRTYKVFALCSATSDAIVARTDFTVHSFLTGGAGAACPPGRRVVGGGINVISRHFDSYPLVQVSGPLDETGETVNLNDGDVARLWYANARAAQEEFPGGSVAYAVSALCSATSDAIVEETSFVAPQDTPVSAVATCPAGRRVVGGGIGTTADDVLNLLHVSGPLDETGSTQGTVDGDTAYSWYAYEENFNMDRIDTVAALCATSDQPVVPRTKPADFDGDGDTDVSVFRPSSGTWFVQGGPTLAWGTNGDIPVPGDYDGDADTDIAVYRPSNGYWFVTGGAITQFGTTGDIPVPGDYDGDADTDVAVYRPSNGYWFVNGGAITQFGTTGDIPVPGDYDGDGDTDVAVFRPANGYWFVRGGTTTQFGTSNDVPVPGDYDADGRSDVAVFRPSSGYWFVNGGLTTQFGASGDIPLPLPDAIRRFFFA